MVWLPAIQGFMQRALVVEIPIAPVDRQMGRRDCHQEGPGSSLDHLVSLARSENDNLVTEAARRPQLGFDIGAHAATRGGVERADIDDPHPRWKRAGPVNFK